MAIDFVFNSGRSMGCSPTEDKRTAIGQWIYHITELPNHAQITTNFDLKYEDHNNTNNNNNKISVKKIVITAINIITI